MWSLHTNINIKSGIGKTFEKRHKIDIPQYNYKNWRRDLAAKKKKQNNRPSPAKENSKNLRRGGSKKKKLTRVKRKNDCTLAHWFPRGVDVNSAPTTLVRKPRWTTALIASSCARVVPCRDAVAAIDTSHCRRRCRALRSPFTRFSDARCHSQAKMWKPYYAPLLQSRFSGTHPLFTPSFAV